MRQEYFLGLLLEILSERVIFKIEKKIKVKPRLKLICIEMTNKNVNDTHGLRYKDSRRQY